MKLSEKIMSVLHKVLWGFVYALPAALFFSYYPVISLGSNNSMNFELSIPLLWLAIFDVLAFIWMIWWGIRQKQKGKTFLEGISDRRFFLLALFPLYLTISVFWSENQLRGLLTAAVMWAVFFAIFAILFVLPLGGKPRKLRTHVLLIFFIATVLVCKFCFAQSIMDILGIDREHTLLCLGCTYRSFGFPHPSGFAIEPQFMGNLLLAPALTAMYLLVFRERKAYKKLTKEVDSIEDAAEQQILHKKIKLPRINWERWRNVGLTILAGFISMTLFFTFSRGAIYAYVVALIVLLIVAIIKHKFRWSLITVPAVSLVLALSLQGVFAAVGPTAETFVSGITKSIHQLSLGIVDLRPSKDSSTMDNSQIIVEKATNDCENNVDKATEAVEKTPKNVESTVDNSNDECIKPIQGTINLDITAFPADAELLESSTNDPVFDGYVAESTNIRLNLNSAALKTWSKSLDRIFFGVGLGGAGIAMHAVYPEEVTSPKEIVQHEGFSLLLESGLIGIGLAIFGLLVAFFPRIFSSKLLDGRAASTNKPENTFWLHPTLPLLLALVVAYLITLNFFSGLPNALQIYLMPPLLYLIFQEKTKTNPKTP